jgi:HTH-type transcriptional regulator/antitoxin HigA
MTTRELETIRLAWPSLTDVLFVPHTEQDYERLVRILDTLIDVVGEQETHPLASLMEIIGVLIKKYEDEHISKLFDL